MRKIFFALSLMSVICLSGCGFRKEDRFDNVVAVYMHEPTKYSVAIANGAGSEIEIVEVTSGIAGRDGKIKIYRDVPSDKPMWVRRVVDNGLESFLVVLEFHIHSASDVQGGGWNHGKFGRGQTHVIDVAK